MTNYQRTANWLKACGKEQLNEKHLSVQIGVHIEEFVEFLNCLSLNADEQTMHTAGFATQVLNQLAAAIKSGEITASISDRLAALDALCDSEVTGNGVAYLCDFDKDGADQEVLRSNDSKLENGKPVLAPGGKILKGKNYTAPELEQFI